jgi:hypothetical protein
MAPAPAGRHRSAAVSLHLAQIGVPGQVLDVLAGGDVDTAGRLLSVAELQTALGLALPRSRPDVDHRTDGKGWRSRLRDVTARCPPDAGQPDRHRPNRRQRPPRPRWPARPAAADGAGPGGWRTGPHHADSRHSGRGRRGRRGRPRSTAGGGGGGP